MYINATYLCLSHISFDSTSISEMVYWEKDDKNDVRGIPVYLCICSDYRNATDRFRN